MKYGINTFELTLNSTEPVAAMQAIKREHGDQVCVGMGTVLNPEDARRVLDAGADFVVSPAFQPEVVQTVLAADVLMAPGVITPSEAVQAWELGVKLLKLFPIGALGVAYYRAMFGPLDHMRFMCNGNMHAEDVLAFLQAGAVACGTAGWLTGSGKRSVDSLAQHAAQIQRAVTTAEHGAETLI